jgi:hypothetical protein
MGIPHNAQAFLEPIRKIENVVYLGPHHGTEEVSEMADESLGVDPNYQIPDELWERIKPLLPAPKPKKKPGRPRMDDRKAMTAIFYVLRTGLKWKALPRSLGAPSTAHDRFQEWREAGVQTGVSRAPSAAC